MSRFGRGGAEIDDRPTAAAASPDEPEIAAMTSDLERLANEPVPRPSAGFADRVAAAIAAEPVPVPAAAATRAIANRSLAGLLAALRDSARVAFGPRRPVAARAGALALLLAATVMAFSAGGAVAVGAASILAPAFHSEPRPPAVQLSPSPSPSPSPALTTTPATSPEPSASSGETHGPSGQTDQTEPARPSAGPSRSPGATDSDQPHDTPRPSDADNSPDPNGGHGSGSGGGPG
jgi:hypothetical protein